MAGFKRVERINDLLRQAISSFLLSEVEEPLLAGVAVTRVQTAPDLAAARVFYRIIEGLVPAGEEKELTLSLERAGHLLRRRLGKELDLKRIPALRFVVDETLEQVNQIESLFQQLDQEKTAADI